MANRRIGFIGVGNIASALLTGILDSHIEPPGNLVLFDIFPEKLGKYTELGCHAAESEQDVVSRCDTIFLAVKPQNFGELLDKIKDSVDESKLLVSVAAGISIASICKGLGKTVPVIRALPNTPMLLGKGVTAATFVPPATGTQFEYVKKIFSSCSSVYFVDENLFHEITCVHSSSPAYIFYFFKAMVDSAEAQGISREQASRMIAGTFLGAVNMIENTGLSCEELIRMVASKGGTTEASLRTFDENELSSIIDKGMRACTSRSKELGGE